MEQQDYYKQLKNFILLEQEIENEIRSDLERNLNKNLFKTCQ